MLPLLRQELRLYPGPATWDGTPQWTLHDPARNRFFRLSWIAFEILSRWHLPDGATILAALRQETTLQDLNENHINEVAHFLLLQQLVQVQTPAQGEQLLRQARAKTVSWPHWLLHHYLYFRIPLARPDRLLQQLLPWLAFLFSRTFLWLTLTALLLGLGLLLAQWPLFQATLIDTLTLPGLLRYGMAIALIKIIHELAHALTAKRLGCRVPSMGIAFLVLWPVLYTDVNETWKLPHRQQRLSVAAAGVLAELAVAAWSTLLWSFMPPGELRNLLFVFAAVSWLSSLAINLSPFMRFDGYFLLMDLLEMPNLHQRAFAMARWQLREWLFRLELPPPEPLSAAWRWRLLLFAWATWIYRLLLFFGIALLVYHFFIKLVGIALFVVEIGWFIIRPVWAEAAICYRLWRGQQARGRLSLRAALLLLLLLLPLLLPWQQSIRAAAILKPAEQIALYLPLPARLQQILVSAGQTVQSGESLFLFADPQLQGRLARVEAEIGALSYEVQAIAYDRDFRSQAAVLREQLAKAMAEKRGLWREMDRLRITAPFAGQVVDLLPELQPGAWYAGKEQLARLHNRQQWQVEAYVSEEERMRLEEGASGQFYPESPGRSPIPVTLSSIDSAPIRTLPDAELASSHGGPIPARLHHRQLYPEGTYYRLRLQVTLPDPAEAQLLGTLHLSAQGESLLLTLARHALATLIREGGM
ncbi:MAG: HlyD family efflux transporter periplasmic adaptor subunit [Magnetococcales bacterium]|nr:HlyD family efflux transporter periplasmic adaptor subunit [Magnetococcales bacterium]